MKNYEDKNPVIATRIKEPYSTKLNYAKKEKTAAEFTRDVLYRFLDGELVPAKKNMQAEMDRARLRKYELDNRLTEIKIEWFEKFGTPLNPSSTRIISRGLKHQVLTSGDVKSIENKSPYDELNKRINCAECGVLFEWINQSGFIDQIAEFTNHMKIKHSRELNVLEKDVIDKLEFPGASHS
jgi:hypothetical protein